MTGLRAEHRKRKKVRDPETCCTPPLAEDMLWPEIDEDPLGIYNEMGGRSSPATPPPLRAVRLTPIETADKIITALEKVRKEASSHEQLKEQELKENMASHDVAITKFRHYVEQSRNRFLPRDKKNSWSPSLGGRNSGPRPCSLHCPGANGMIPNLQCISCKCLFHGRCQGASMGARNFRCRACVVKSQNRKAINENMIKLKLPMKSLNGKRPVVEIVMEQKGRYQPIKFSNNMQITETIPKVMFDQANVLRKTVYQKCMQVSI